MKLDRAKLPAGFVADPERPTEVTVTIIDDDLWGQDGCNIQPPRLSVKGDRGVRVVRRRPYRLHGVDRPG